MIKLPILDMQGKRLGEYDLSEDLLAFNKGQQALHEWVVAHMARKRAGTASTLNKGEVSGSNAKPWKQKGLGRARAGYRRSPIWRGGGVVFGPKPRKYTKKVPKKVARLAFNRAFSERVAAGQVGLLENFTLPEPKTKDMVAMITKLDVQKGVLFLVQEMQKEWSLASRNLPQVRITTSQNVSVYEMLRYPHVMISQEAMAGLEERLKTVRGK